MSFRKLSDAVHYCCLCGYESSQPADFEPFESIQVWVLGEPMEKRLYRCRDHDACTARVRAQADAAAMARREALNS